MVVQAGRVGCFGWVGGGGGSHLAGAAGAAREARGTRTPRARLEPREHRSLFGALLLPTQAGPPGVRSGVWLRTAKHGSSPTVGGGRAAARGDGGEREMAERLHLRLEPRHRPRAARRPCQAYHVARRVRPLELLGGPQPARARASRRVAAAARRGLALRLALAFAFAFALALALGIALSLALVLVPACAQHLHGCDAPQP